MMVSSSLPPLDIYLEEKTKFNLFSQIFNIWPKYFGSNDPSALNIQR